MVGKLFGLVVVVLVGVGAWNLGNRLSNDAVSMAYGLIFGAAATMFPVLLITFAWRQAADCRPTHDYQGAAQLAQPARPAQLAQPHIVVVLQAPRGYSTARPFALPGVTVDGEVVK